VHGFNGHVQQFLTASSERWLKCRNEDASKKIVATEILVFDFELFIIGGLFILLGNVGVFSTRFDKLNTQLD